MDGLVPLSPTLDSIGPIARSIQCCAILDAIMAAERPPLLTPRPLAGLRLVAPTNYVLDGMDDDVARAFERALSSLSRAGATIVNISIPELDVIPKINAKGGFAAAESYNWHSRLKTQPGESYDPRVIARIRRGGDQSASDYLDIIEARARLIAAVTSRMSNFAAIICPTVPIVAPRMETLATDEAFSRLNLLALRNPSIANLIDGCAVSIPVHERGEAPVGLMLTALRGRDASLLGVAFDVEAALLDSKV